MKWLNHGPIKEGYYFLSLLGLRKRITVGTVYPVDTTPTKTLMVFFDGRHFPVTSSEILNWAGPIPEPEDE